MAADLGGFADVLLLAGLAAGFAWWYCNKPTAKAEQKTGQPKGEKKGDGAPAASVTPVINIIFQSDVVEEEVAEKLADLFHNGRTFYYTGGRWPRNWLTCFTTEEPSTTPEGKSERKHRNLPTSSAIRKWTGKTWKRSMYNPKY